MAPVALDVVTKNYFSVALSALSCHHGKSLRRVNVEQMAKKLQNRTFLSNLC